VRTDKRLKLLNNTLQQSQTVVFSERSQKVFEDLVLVTAGNVLQFLDDLLLVAHTQGGRVEDGGEFGVLFEDLAELSERFGD
jgi:predicted TPR repeat methyltransferase